MPCGNIAAFLVSKFRTNATARACPVLKCRFRPIRWARARPGNFVFVRDFALGRALIRSDGDEMTAEEEYEDEYSEYDEYDDEDEGGLSGFSVLMIGIVMLTAFAATTYVFYKQGMKEGERRAGVETPYVAADPEPIKIETADAGEDVADREVYDVFDGEDPAPVTVIDEAPEEPVDRTPEDPIGALAADAADISEDVEDRIASLAEEDASALDEPASSAPVETARATEPTPVNAVPDPTPATTSAVNALAGSHVVQVGAFRSNDEAVATWNRMQSRLGNVIGAKTYDVERADLGERGVYHRLRIGPFSSSEAANTYCATLKENGQDCLPKGI